MSLHKKKCCGTHMSSSLSFLSSSPLSLPYFSLLSAFLLAGAAAVGIRPELVPHESTTVDHAYASLSYIKDLS